MYGNAIIEAASKPYVSIVQAALGRAAHKRQDAQANPVLIRQHKAQMPSMIV